MGLCLTRQTVQQPAGEQRAVFRWQTVQQKSSVLSMVNKKGNRQTGNEHAEERRKSRARVGATDPMAGSVARLQAFSIWYTHVMHHF
jgi:hypothetical protein